MNAREQVLPKVHWELEQGTDEWHAARAGKWGSSKADTIMSTIGPKGGMGKTLEGLVKDVAWGRIFGPVEGGYKNAAMERGNLVEPQSRDWYSAERQVAVFEAGLVEHATIPHVIWSPDGVLLKELQVHAGIEAKNPLHRAFMDCKRCNAVPAEYVDQCQWATWVGKLEWLDFVCYRPEAGGIVIRVEPDLQKHKEFEERVLLLEEKVAGWIKILRGF